MFDQDAQTRDQEAEELVTTARRIRGKLLRRMEHIIDHAPTGLVTEEQDKKTGRVYKLADLVASFKNVAGKPGSMMTDDLDAGNAIDGGDED